MSPMEKLRAILITGANGHLGREAITYFHRAKISPVAACRNQAERSALQSHLAEQGISIPVLEADLAHEGHVERMMREAEQKGGGTIDAVLNVAGAFEMFPTVEAVKEQVDRLMDANFTSNWLLLKHALPSMIRRGFGRVVLISANATTGAAGGAMGFYVASKSALNAIVQSTAAEVAAHNIRINAVMPTIIDTPRNRADMPNADFSKWVKAETLLGEISRLLAPAAATPNGTLVRVG